jgi:non-ribosomal peptide synthetase component F
MYMLLLASFITLLARYTGKECISLFVIFANRNRLETQSLIGWFSNVQVFNTDLSNVPRFVDLLERIRALVLDDYAHQEIPYSLLFGELLQRTRNYRMPRRLYEASYIFFDLRVEDEAAFEATGLTVSPVEIPGRSADELSMLAIERAGQLKLKLNYAFDRFADQQIAEFLRDFAELLGTISVQPTTRLAELTRKPA